MNDTIEKLKGQPFNLKKMLITLMAPSLARRCLKNNRQHHPVCI